MQLAFELSTFLCLPQSVTLPELPAVVVFKDGAYFTYDGECCVTLASATVVLFLSVSHTTAYKCQ